MKSIWLINLTKNIHPFLGGVIFTLYFSLLIGFALAASSIFIEILGTPINWIASVVVIIFSLAGPPKFSHQVNGHYSARNTLSSYEERTSGRSGGKGADTRTH